MLVSNTALHESVVSRGRTRHQPRRRFVRSWANFLTLYRNVADEWQVYDNSVSPPFLLQESRGWQRIREPRPIERTLARDDPDAHRRIADRGQEYLRIWRSHMTGQPGRIPEGEPSVKSVLAALARAQERARARAAAVADAEASQGPAGDVAPEAAPSDLESARSGTGNRT